MQPKQLTKRFQAFLGNLRATAALSPTSRAEQEDVLENEYRALQEAFSRLSDSQARECLGLASEVEARLIQDHLLLGRSRINALRRPLAKLIEADPGRTDWAISAFMNRHAAYLLIHGKDKAEDALALDEQSQHLLASILGVEGVALSEQFVRKVRTELLAGCLAYAHARLCKRDLAQWHADPGLREHFEGNVEDYLLACIERSQAGLYYVSGEPEDPSDGSLAPQLPIACVIQEHPVALEPDPAEEAPGKAMKQRRTDGMGQTAERLKADACAVNHEEKLIVVGGATTNAQDNAKQLVSLTRLVRALELMVAIDPRWAGYRVQSFFLHGGYFSAAEEAKNGLRIRFVQDLRKAGMSQHHIETLARTAFYNLLSERSPSPERGRVFLQINPHVAGCGGTLGQYEAAQEAAGARPNSRAPARAVLAELDQTVEAILSPAFDVKKGGVPREAIVHGVLGALQNFYVLFPVENNQRVSQEERKLLDGLCLKIQDLAAKLAEVDFGAAAGQFYSLAKEMRESDQKSWMDFQLTSARKKPVCRWSEEIHQELLKRKKIFDIDPRTLPESAIAPFLPQVAQGTVPALIREAVAECLSAGQRTLMNPREADLMATALAQMEDIALDASKGYVRSPRERDAGMASNESFVQTLRNASDRLAKGELPDEPNLPAATFRLMSAFFQMDHRQLEGSKASPAFSRAGPAFLRACLLGSDGLRLSGMALGQLDPSVGGSLPRKARPTRR